jgi:hypothetical protein
MLAACSSLPVASASEAEAGAIMMARVLESAAGGPGWSPGSWTTSGLVTLMPWAGVVLEFGRVQTRKSPIPVPPIPDLARNRGRNPRFPIWPGTGIGVPIGRKSGNRGYPSV